MSLHSLCPPLKAALLLALLCCPASPAAAQTTKPADAAKRPNILFVLTEDQGPHLSFLGTPGLDTPNMDRLARAGVYFDRAYVAYPVCSPSKASIYTGTYAHTNGMLSNTQNFFVPAEKLTPAQRNNGIYQRCSVKPELATMTEILKDAGYYSAVSGKLHVAPNEKFPYDEWFKPNDREHTAAFLADAKKAGKPFFFFSNIQSPHRPFPNSDEVKIDVDPAAVELPPYLPDTPVARQDWAEYLANCEVADKQLGDVMAALDEAGVTDNTIIIFMGDHGPGYHRAKMTLYQTGLQVPLAISGPGVPQGVRTDEMVSEVDLLPTLMNLLDLPVPDNQQGQSFAGLVRGEPGAKGRQRVFAEVIHGGQTTDDGMQERSIFDGRFKLIYRENRDRPRDVNTDLKYFVFVAPNGNKYPWHNRVYDEIVKNKDEYPKQFALLEQIDPQSFGVTPPKFELYDTQSDPDEFENVSGESAYAADEARLKGELRQWLIDTNDRFVTPDEVR